MLSRGVAQVTRTAVRYGAAGAPKHPQVMADCGWIPNKQKMVYGGLLCFFLYAGPTANNSGK